MLYTRLFYTKLYILLFSILYYTIQYYKILLSHLYPLLYNISDLFVPVCLSGSIYTAAYR